MVEVGRREGVGVQEGRKSETARTLGVGVKTGRALGNEQGAESNCLDMLELERVDHTLTKGKSRNVTRKLCTMGESGVIKRDLEMDGGIKRTMDVGVMGCMWNTGLTMKTMKGSN